MSSNKVMIWGLTIWQPWAGAIVLGHKPLENRNWIPRRIKVGDFIAIHAGHQTDFRPHTINLFQQQDVNHTQAVCNQTGAIIGVVKYDGYVTESDSPWFFGKYGWLMSEPVVIEPVLCCRLMFISR